jgi:imidazolonepropionase-like amidohydrolase
LIVVNGDPLSDISILRKAENIKIVVKGGKIEKHLRSNKIIAS